jgi:phosphonate utilization associated putative membrane protein
MNSALLAIALSVIMHVAWNLLARHVDRRCNYLWWGLLAHIVLLGPWALWELVTESIWSSDLIIAIVVTAIANTLYFLALRQAYHYAPVALVYPEARSSPALIALWAWLLFDQTIPINGVVGIGISIIGLWIMAATSRGDDTAHALPWAIIAAVGTSIYSLSDKVAVSFLPTFGAQLGFITVGYICSFLALTLAQWRTTGRPLPPQRPKWIYLVTGGLFIGTAYALVVRAMLELPASYVVAFTNSGIVLATLLSIGLLKEREQWQGRLIAAVIISCGLAILGLNLIR